MDVYLPIANLSVNGLWIVALGGLTGILSGLFGVGGGFLTTPLLIFYGIPPTVAAASASTQVTGASVTGVLAHGDFLVHDERRRDPREERAQEWHDLLDDRYDARLHERVRALNVHRDVALRRRELWHAALAPRQQQSHTDNDASAGDHREPSPADPVS